MDNKVDTKPPSTSNLSKYKIKGDMMFDIIKNTIIKENEALLKIVSKKYRISYETLREKYIQPEFYLPLVQK